MPSLRELLQLEVFGRRRRPFFWLRLWKMLYFGHGGRGCIAWLRLAQHHHAAGRLRQARACAAQIERRYGCYIAPSARIGPGLQLPHPTGIVIGVGVTIGARAMIFQNVTIGGRDLGAAKRGDHPTLGDDVVVFAGAKILGALQLGDRCRVGANAVVLHDAPDDSRLVGAPARPTTQRATAHADVE